MSQYKNVCKRLVPCDEADVAVRVFAGYQFNRNWSVEIGGGQFGEARGSGAAGSFAWESYAWDCAASATFTSPAACRLFGRLGMYRVRTTVDQAFSCGTKHDANTKSG